MKLSVLLFIVCLVLLSACTQPVSDTNVLPSDPTTVVSSTVNPGASDMPFPTDQSISILGEAVCLPHKAKGEMHTMECAYGIKDASGMHYGVQLSDADLQTFQVGETYTIEGYVKEEPTSIYDIKGVIKVTTLE